MAEPALARSLGLRSAVLLVVGNVVGAGIFTTSGFLASEVADPRAFLAVWAIGGLLTLAGAFTYAELGALLPRAGGDYQYLKEAYGPWAGFLLGWLAFWIITPGSVAALALALMDHVPGLPEQGPWRTLGAIATVVVLSGVSFVGTRVAEWAQNAITLGSVILLVALVVLGAVHGTGSLEHFSPPATSQGFRLSGAALIAVVFTYSGWFASAYLGAEIRDPQRNLPRSLVLGVLAVAVLYVAVNAIYLYALPLERMAGTTDVAKAAGLALFGPRNAALLGAAIFTAIASCINASIMTGSRICWAMARDGLFLRRLGAVHPRFKTPHVAIAAQAALSIGLILLGSFDALLSYVTFAMLLTSLGAGGALFVLRARWPDAPRPYRTPGYPIVPALFLLGYGWITVSVGWERPLTSLAGLGITLTGLPFYLWWRRRVQRAER